MRFILIKRARFTKNRSGRRFENLQKKFNIMVENIFLAQIQYLVFEVR